MIKTFIEAITFSLPEAFTYSITLITFFLTLFPEETFSLIKLVYNIYDGINIIFVRLLIYAIIFIIVLVFVAGWKCFRHSISIKGKNYKIKIQYGDIFKVKNCKKLISFDECFTVNVGNQPEDVNPNSICGQYLQKKPINDIQVLIDKTGLQPLNSKSEFQKQDRYKSGKIVQRDNDLLMSFAKLDINGLGKFDSYNEYTETLSTLWEEINKYYGQQDVCIPILGSGVTRMNGNELTQQELLDIIIISYKLSPYKIKSPNKLIIICKKQVEFSLNKIGETI